MINTYGETPDYIYADFKFESCPRGVQVRVVFVEEDETQASTFLSVRDTRRLTEWLSRWSRQSFITPEWTLRYVDDDPDLELVLRKGRMADKSLLVSPYEVRPAIEALERILL